MAIAPFLKATSECTGPLRYTNALLDDTPSVWLLLSGLHASRVMNVVAPLSRFPAVHPPRLNDAARVLPSPLIPSAVS